MFTCKHNIRSEKRTIACYGINAKEPLLLEARMSVLFRMEDRRFKTYYKHLKMNETYKWIKKRIENFIRMLKISPEDKKIAMDN